MGKCYVFTKNCELILLFFIVNMTVVIAYWISASVAEPIVQLITLPKMLNNSWVDAKGCH
jgi:hypothetical protein